ncbi:Hypothetical protein SCF082_LOCUS1540 [Durusdinium trenchii]|uniref:Uncharacterized protein n=1 Tax=Durusdinium trenchii TaxID=1381693 RepID=A0ABP0HF75_9DINO
MCISFLILPISRPPADIPSFSCCKLLSTFVCSSETRNLGSQSSKDIGTGEPLFCNFGFEDWALLSLRFELHLLAHAFLHDCGDPERSGIYPDHLLFYYSRYFKKGLNPKNYGVDNVEELVGLVRDAVVLMCPPKVLESTLAAELEGNVEG